MLLDEWTFEVGGVVFGHGTPLQVDDVTFEDVSEDVGDVALPLDDGIVMGVDVRGGRVITFEVSTDTLNAVESRAVITQLATVWDAWQVRSTPRAVIELSIRIPGGEVRSVLGRPRRMTPARLRERADGRETWVATFQTTHAGFFGAEETITLTMVAPGGGGITWPVTWPVTWAASGERQDAVVNRGDLVAWPIITIRGPVAQPALTLVGAGKSLRLDTTLAYDQSVTVDTRPGHRTVLRSDGASLAGSVRGAALADFWLPPGQTVLHYSGTDLTGQSSATVTWRPVYAVP